MTVNKYNVFHGTNLFSAYLIKQYGVSLEAQRSLTDFGRGFYVTFDWKQAVRWASVRAGNLQVSANYLEKLGISIGEYLNHPASRIPVIIVYNIDIERLLRLKGMIFPFPHHYSWAKSKGTWEEFVLKCRQGYTHPYDFVYGPIAGGHFKDEKNIKVSKTKDQLSLHSQQALNCLTNVQIVLGKNERDQLKLMQETYLVGSIQKACSDILGLHREQRNDLVLNSWLTSLHPSIVRMESPYYWAFSLLEGNHSLWHDVYEKWMIENRKINLLGSF